MSNQEKKILVIGGGISGMSAALDASETGYSVILIEKRPSLGGRVSRFHQYFPKLCPPMCGLEINYKRIRPNKNLQVLTSTEALKISGEAPDLKVTLKTSPTYVNHKCTACGDCVDVCPSERPDAFNFGMNKTRAIYLPQQMAYPNRFVIDRKHCPEGCDKCVVACNYQAIDLNMPAKEQEIDVSSVILATGWKPYDAKKLTHLGFSKFPNVINNIMMERLASLSGPTQGVVVRPSDKKPPKSVAFIQCAGSRDENHLPYCSSICCLASLKQISYVRAQNPEAEIYLFYIDIRTPGKYEDFAARIQEDPKLKLIKGKVAKITETADGSLVMEAEDILKGNKVHIEVDMAVLATGMEPSIAGQSFVGDTIKLDSSGFIQEDQKAGIFSAGVAKMPLDVSSSVIDASGAALKAIQNLRSD
ncbi:MAG: CoB--CoM heterodisulfide reductase iron-sulfur subunit A family protein [Deltaproteobacteria bacterium]|nr:CoB--CoM heterodisulfide reductase iron-sulfur subunit A family protein [Deltaproteobacteria bacterium]